MTLRAPTEASRAWAETQQRADEAFLAVFRWQGEPVAKRHAQQLPRFILLTTPDAPAFEPMAEGLQA